MLSYKVFYEELRHALFILSKNKYNSQTSSSTMIHMQAKHPLVKPELIIVNDRIEGFTPIKKNYSLLNKFEINIDINGVELPEEPLMINHLEIYTEISTSRKHLSRIIHLFHHYQNTVAVDRIISMQEPQNETLIIYSRVMDAIENFEDNQDKNLSEEDFDLDSPYFNEDSSQELIKKIVRSSLTSYTKFLEELNKIICPKKKDKDSNDK